MAAIAERQHGVISRDQLLALGLSEAAVRHATVTGRLHPIFRGAYGVGHAGIGNSGRMLAAVLACGGGSVVSHGTAAVLLGLWDRQPRLVDVIAPVQAGRKIPGILRRHVPPPRPCEAWMHDAVPCTNPSRTIVDVAGIAGEARLRRTVEQAAIHSMLNVPEIDAILAGPRRRGSPRLRAILEGWRRYDSAIRLRSPMEAKLLPLLSQHGIPVPECNGKLYLGGKTIEVDFLWRSQGFVVETDGLKYHDNPEAEARDHRRSRALRAAGYRVWRLRWEDLELRPQVTMAELARRLCAR
ncbi:MAG TPA: type IV toxin-antitoxin system AbiEi family antitoxin domain-containing protein [Solirubrobacterales bacterium]|jgi:very-short-patch-repair endonuclease|nr:type IV toxin-antitoxin system AbiEi family antitoxin domain-containing protein [Solirubrobacterales bacterium]